MRIVFYSGTASWGKLDPELDGKKNRMFGGGERALLTYAYGLSDRGHDVTVVAPITEEKEYNGVKWMQRPHPAVGPSWQAEECDVFIASETPESICHARRSKYRILECQCNHYSLAPYVTQIDAAVARSEWHQNHLLRQEPLFHQVPMSVIGNGVSPERYADWQKNEGKRTKDMRVIYSSSPDRGLNHLLRIWPLVREQLPKATLHVYYEVNNFIKNNRAQMSLVGEMALDIEQDIRQEGVKAHGPVNQDQLARAQMQSSLMVYPCDTIVPTEGFGITVAESIAAGCSVLTTDTDAFYELWNDHTHMMRPPPAPAVRGEYGPLDDDWAKAIVELLQDRAVHAEKRADARAALLEQHTWERVLDQWEELLFGLAGVKEPAPS